MSEQKAVPMSATENAIDAFLTKEIKRMADEISKQDHAACNERIAALEAENAQLKWQPITPENLPKVGDEVLRKRMAAHGELRISTESVVFADANIDDYRMLRCTHFRPINPPQTDGVA